MFKTIHKENPQNNAWHLLMSSFTHLTGASLWHFLFVAPGHTSKEHILWKGRHMSLWPIRTPKKLCFSFCGAFFWVAGFSEKFVAELSSGFICKKTSPRIIKLEENLSFFSIPCAWWCTHNKLSPCFGHFFFPGRCVLHHVPKWSLPLSYHPRNPNGGSPIPSMDMVWVQLTWGPGVNLPLPNVGPPRN